MSEQTDEDVIVVTEGHIVAPRDETQESSVPGGEPGDDELGDDEEQGDDEQGDLSGSSGPGTGWSAVGTGEAEDELAGPDQEVGLGSGPAVDQEAAYGRPDTLGGDDPAREDVLTPQGPADQADETSSGDYAVSGDELADDPVAGDTVTDDPVAGDTVTDDPVTDDTATDETVADGMAADDTAADGTVASDTVIGDPAAGDTLTDTEADDTIPGDSVASDPVMDDTMTGDPELGAPATGSPVTAGTAGQAAASSTGNWHEIQALFVDDPLAAVTQAAEVAADALNTLVEAARNREQLLRGGWQDDETGTEKLRVALRDYRDLTGRLEQLSQQL